MAENKGNQNQGGHSKNKPENVPDIPLEEREYKGKDGETHHHTNVWMERHGEEKGREGGSNREGEKGNR